MQEAGCGYLIWIINRGWVNNIVSNRYSFHIAFWIIFIIAFTLLLGGKYGYLESLKDVSLEALSYATIVYINLLVLVPRFLLKRKYVQYIVLLLLALVIIVPIHSSIEYFNFYNVEDLKGQVKLEKLAFLSLINISFMLALTTGLKLGKEWFNQQQRSQELERERLQSELKFLKSQINPHFLFNTLNNLYSLSLKKSDQAPEMILKLSEMMRYMLYESNEKMVPLEKEIRCIENYIELERIRQGERTKINIQIDWAENGQKIAPLLFIPFLENSFKHGVNSNIDSGWINISLKESNGSLTFLVENNKSKKITQSLNGSGIGLKNVKRRLELLYPDHHQLVITEGDDTYKTDLKIQLS